MTVMEVIPYKALMSLWDETSSNGTSKRKEGCGKLPQEVEKTPFIKLILPSKCVTKL